MPTVTCRLGQDRADAALNRPALVLRAAEVADLSAAAVARETPRLATLLEGGASPVGALGAGQLPGLRLELRCLLDGIGAAQLRDRLTLALALQRLDTACATAQEFGLNLYLTIDDE